MVSFTPSSSFFFPEPPAEFLDKHAKLIEELNPHASSVPRIAVTNHVDNPANKNLADLHGSKLLPGTIGQIKLREKTEGTRAMVPDVPATDARAAARGRKRIEMFAMRSAHWAKAKLRREKLNSDTVHTIEIHAWEDSLRSEQWGVNYMLMHNAVAVAAGKYGEKYPALRQIDAVLAAQRKSPQKVEGMPWICATGQEFAIFAITLHGGDNSDEFRSAIVRNLLETIHLLDPSINVNDEKKDRLFNIIYRNFNNLYERKIDPMNVTQPPGTSETEEIPKLGERADTSENAEKEIDLPFPDKDIMLMARALKHLKNMQPGVARILLSDRNNLHVRKEVERFGLEEFFHYVTGTPLVSVYTPSDVADAERTEPTELGKELQKFSERKEHAIAEMVAQKVAELEASAEGETPAGRAAIAEYLKKMEDLKPSLERVDKDTLLQWKQYHQTTVEDLYRVPDDTLLKDALQAFVEAGIKFSKRVTLVAVGPNEKHVTQTYDLLASGGEITKDVTISKAKGIVVNPGRKTGVQAARQRAKELGLNIKIDHVSSFKDANI